jgi:parallel beta helix pectate lyase-like protein
LQAGLDDADPNDEIWVAAGTYYPTYDYELGIGDRGKHFRMKNRVAIYGGFPATGDPGWIDRDPNTYETILSGDLAGNDEPVDDPRDLRYDPNRSENCYHVFYHPEGANLDPNAVLDGFSISGGNADQFYTSQHGYGGGMYNDYSNPTVTGCTFNANSADCGGGMHNSSSSPAVNNCIFINNSADGYGGGIIGDGTLTNCIFTGNSVGEYGGGFHTNGEFEVINCIVWSNTAMQGGDEISIGGYWDDDDGWEPATISVSYSDVQGGYAAVYLEEHDCTLNWGDGNIDADPMFKDPNGPDGIIGTADDNLQLAYNSPCIDAGDNAAVPADTTDLDGDGDTTERIPLDFAIMAGYWLEYVGPE